MSNRKTWFVSYRLQPRPVRAGHARTSKTFGSESEAKAFARELPSAVSDVTAGTINPHVPKKFYGSADIFKWLADDPSGVDPEGNWARALKARGTSVRRSSWSVRQATPA
jgi:hypothetical protein